MSGPAKPNLPPPSPNPVDRDSAWRSVMTRHLFYEWTFTLVGVACLMKWLFGDDQDALIVASMSFVLSTLHGIRGDIATRVLPPAETDAP